MADGAARGSAVDFLIFGSGGHAKVVIESLSSQNPGARILLLDDRAATHGRQVLGFAVVGGRQWLQENRSAAPLFAAIGDNRSRGELIEWFSAEGLPMIEVIDPTAVVSKSARVAPAAFIAPSATVNAEAEIHEGAIINTSASVDHDCTIGRAAHVAPGARLAGGVTVGARTLIGTGAVVIPGVRIGEDALIGAGSVVIRDVPAGARVAGVPAQPL